MSLEDLLPQVCTVYRRQVVGGEVKKDPFGQPTRDELPSHTLPCRINTPKGGERMQERSHDVVHTTTKLFLSAGADLRESDVVTVTDSVGNVLVERAEVTLVSRPYDMTSEHHVEAYLNNQRQAT